MNLIKGAFCAAFLLLTFGLMAQNSTMAYVDVEAVVKQMSEYKKIEAELKIYQGQHVKLLDQTKKEIAAFYQQTLEAVKAGNLTTKGQQEAEQKLQKMQAELQQMTNNADRGLVEKEKQLSKPMYDKFKAAVAKIAKANDYHYVIDKQFILNTTSKGIDATTKLKEALGI